MLRLYSRNENRIITDNGEIKITKDNMGMKIIRTHWRLRFPQVMWNLNHRQCEHKTKDIYNKGKVEKVLVESIEVTMVTG